MGDEATPKQYLRIAGRSVLEHCAAPFLNHPRIAGIVVAVAPGDAHWPRLPLAREPAVRNTPGGAHRGQSVLNCLRMLADTGAHRDDWVLVHDAARPLLRRTDLDALMQACADHPAGGLLALPVRDTLKRSEDGRQAALTVSRESLWQALTPQMFRLGTLRETLEELLGRGLRITDEAEAMELGGARPLLVRGRPDNLKLTYPEDLALLEHLLAERPRCA